METQELRKMVAAARGGSEDAYRQIVDSFGSPLLGYFFRNTGNRAEAEDLLQELLLRLVKGLKRYREKERFEVWLFQMARHLMIDHWRKKKIPLSGQDEPAEADPAPGPGAQAMAREVNDELQRALEQLSPDQREAIAMRYFSGLSFEEIARTGRIPIGTALAKVHRGLEKLRKILSRGDI